MRSDLKPGFYVIVNADWNEDNGKIVAVVGYASNGDVVVEKPEWEPTISSGTFDRYDRWWSERHLRPWKPAETALDQLVRGSVSVASFDGTMADPVAESVGRGE